MSFPFWQLFPCAAGLSEDSDYTSDVSYPNQQQHPFAQSYHHANSSSSQFESTARKLKPCLLNASDQFSQHTANTNATFQEKPIEMARPKRELPFGGSTDPQNIKMATQMQKSNGACMGAGPAGSQEELDSLFYNSRPMRPNQRRALPQINYNNKENQPYVFW